MAIKDIRNFFRLKKNWNKVTADIINLFSLEKETKLET